MKELMMCALVLMVSLYLFLSFGSLLLQWMGQRFRLTWALVLGFFSYFALFQILYLPCMLLQTKLFILSAIWMLLCAGAGVFAMIRCRRIWGTAWCLWIRSLCRHRWRSFLILCAILLVLWELYYMVRYGYNGYDTQFYIGTVNTSVYTDSIYLYDAVTGLKEGALPFRYALSGFYTNAAVFSQVFHVVPALFMRYVTGAVCCLMANSVLFELGRTMFERRKTENGCWTVMLGISLNFFFRTMYTTSEFLLLRSYEAKAFCANVVLPAILLVCIWIWKRRDHVRWWRYLGIILAAANTVSMSSILTAPAMASVLLAGPLLTKKGHSRVKSFLICMIPCVLYLAVYLLAMKRILVIRVR